ncbi:MAG: hypothetical protein ABL876_15790 [Chitinophagaceae bacterium]
MKHKNSIVLVGCIVAAILFILPSCQKEAKGDEDQSRGTNFGLLQKTVATYSYSTRKTTVNYTYNANRQLVETKTTDSDPSGNNTLQTETFFRDAAGRLDSSSFVNSSNGVIDYRSQTFYTYDVSGKLILSFQNVTIVSQPYKDSSVYTYAGNTLQQRKDYRSFSGGAYNLLRDAAYQFDASGNLTQTIFHWTTHPGPDTANFQYDNKVNALPVDRLVFYWAPLFYDDYKPSNNLKRAVNAKIDFPSYNYEYQYTINNKPLYRKTIEMGSAIFYETLYYYD